MDFLQRVSSVPAAGETVASGMGYELVPGGKGAVVSRALASFGADCVLSARIGDDANGRMLKDRLSEDGVDTRFLLTTPDMKTALTSIFAEENGARRAVTYRGAAIRLCAADVELAFNSYPDAVFLKLDVPESAISAAAHFARSQKVPLFVDGDCPMPRMPLSELGAVEVFTLDETEIKEYTGIGAGSAESCLRAAIRLCSMVTAKYIVIKLGARGAFVYDGKYYHVIASHDVDTVDNSGAGDVFFAALAYYYMQNRDILFAVRAANVAGALTVAREGAYLAVPTRAELSEFVRSRGIRLSDGAGERNKPQ